jgi:hypothetical protein
VPEEEGGAERAEGSTSPVGARVLASATSGAGPSGPDASPPSGGARLDTVSDLDVAPPPSLTERAGELHALLVGFASGEPLPEDRREAVLRLVVAALLRRGALDEAFIEDVLGPS